jgi:hypothetical protein
MAAAADMARPVGGEVKSAMCCAYSAHRVRVRTQELRRGAAQVVFVARSLRHVRRIHGNEDRFGCGGT